MPDFHSRAIDRERVFVCHVVTAGDAHVADVAGDLDVGDVLNRPGEQLPGRRRLRLADGGIGRQRAAKLKRPEICVVMRSRCIARHRSGRSKPGLRRQCRRSEIAR